MQSYGYKITITCISSAVSGWKEAVLRMTDAFFLWMQGARSECAIIWVQDVITVMQYQAGDTLCIVRYWMVFGVSLSTVSDEYGVSLRHNVGCLDWKRSTFSKVVIRKDREDIS